MNAPGWFYRSYKCAGYGTVDEPEIYEPLVPDIRPKLLPAAAADTAETAENG